MMMMMRAAEARRRQLGMVPRCWLAAYRECTALAVLVLPPSPADALKDRESGETNRPLHPLQSCAQFDCRGSHINGSKSSSLSLPFHYSCLAS